MKAIDLWITLALALGAAYWAYRWFLDAFPRFEVAGMVVLLATLLGVAHLILEWATS